MKVVFMGTPSYATEIFKALLKDKDIEVRALFTQPDKKAGRKMLLTPPHIKEYCLKNDLNIPIFQPESLKEEWVEEKIRSISPDFIVVAAYGQILPKSILNIASCINLHASILPKYRGASPIQSAILNGDEFTGITAMLMNEGLDSGDMLSFSYTKIGDKNVVELFDELSKMAARLCVKTLKEFKNLKPIKQLDALASYAKKITKDDGLIEFADASLVYRKFKAFYFWPGIFLKSGLKLKEIEIAEREGEYDRGKILSIDDNRSIIVGCKKGSIRVFKLQPPSKKEMGAVEYIRGKRLKVGDYLS